MTQKPENVHVRDFVMADCNYAFTVWPKYAYDVEEIHATDSQFNCGDRLVRYRETNDGEPSEYAVTGSFTNCAVDGEWVTDYHIYEEPDNADAEWLTIDVDVSWPDDRTPSEYFGSEFIW